MEVQEQGETKENTAVEGQNTEQQQQQTDPGQQGDQSTERPKWLYQLKGDLQQNEALTKYDTLSDLGNAFVELNGKLERSVEVPGEDADENAVQDFYAKLGRPEGPGDYELPKIEGAKDGDDTELRNMFHEAGLSNTQAKKLHGSLAKSLQEAAEDYQRQVETKSQENVKTMQKEWGNKYEDNLEKVRQAFSVLGGGDEFAQSLMETGLIYGPDTMRMGLRIADRVLEDSFFNGSKGGGTAADDAASWYPRTEFS